MSGEKDWIENSNNRTLKARCSGSPTYSRFCSKRDGSLLSPEVIQGPWQLAFSILCVVGVGMLELLVYAGKRRCAEQVQKWTMATIVLLMPTATLCMTEVMHGTFIY